VSLIGAELHAPALWRHFPPRSKVTLPPAFPAIARDVSLIVAEAVRFEQIEQGLRRHAGVGGGMGTMMEGIAFVTTYRGKPIPAGQKSVTVRLSFRDPARTLTHEEVDAPVAETLAGLRKELEFTIRA
jgi:phenylalanyl-tRNA synthetase beta chain